MQITVYGKKIDDIITLILSSSNDCTGYKYNIYLSIKSDYCVYISVIVDLTIADFLEKDYIDYTKSYTWSVDRTKSFEEGILYYNKQSTYINNIYNLNLDVENINKLNTILTYLSRQVWKLDYKNIIEVILEIEKYKKGIVVNTTKYDLLLNILNMSLYNF